MDCTGRYQGSLGKAVSALRQAVCCRIPYAEMRDRTARPYLMGEQQRPQCTNCAKDELWSHFCQYKSHGPACPQYDQDTLFETIRSR